MIESYGNQCKYHKKSMRRNIIWTRKRRHCGGCKLSSDVDVKLQKKLHRMRSTGDVERFSFYMLYLVRPKPQQKGGGRGFGAPFYHEKY